MAININDYLLASLREGQSAETLAKDLSAALQAAEKQITEEKKIAEEAAAKEKLCEQSSQLKSDLCDCLRNYMSYAHKKTYNKLLTIHGQNFTDDELIDIVDSTIKNTAVALRLYETFEELFPTEKEQPVKTNWEKLFSDFFDKYNL